MLLGVIQLQMELLRALDQWRDQPHTARDDFELKKQLISESIYGVDIKEWAVRIAELRLWLYMIAEAEFTTEELTEAPLLPNLDFKIRQGNSLLPKLGSLDFDIKALLKGRDKRSGAAKRLNDFIKQKKKFIRNELPDETYRSLKDQELSAVTGFVQALIQERSAELTNLKRRKQRNMFGDDEEDDVFKERRDELEEEIEALEETQKKIRETGQLPFSYDIDFMEVFLTEDDPGFDLVIGNPPYVRQENILPPEDPEYLEYLLKEENADEKRKVNKAYKKELSNKVFDTYPFLDTTIRTEVNGRKRTIPVYGRKVPGRSDLYVYFQLLCPQYLNSNGTFCFIISNSWMDVDYGSFVQQFLLKHTNLHAIYDSNVRSFAAKVNTVIYLHSALQNTDLPERDIKTLEPPESTVRFVMNKTNYTDAAYAPVLVEQEHCTENTFREFYRVIVESQAELFETGYDEESAKFEGDKWGGKYLRAPEIYFTILDKGRGKFKKLKKFANVRRGYTTGANDFFIINKERADEFNIEGRFLTPIIKSSREIQTIRINTNRLCNYLFTCDKEKDKIKGTNALNYINWGENQGHHEGRTCQSRKIWYNVGFRKKAAINCNYMVNEYMRFYLGDIAVSDNFQEIHAKKDKMEAVISLNSSVFALMLNIVGRANFGDGLMKLQTYEVANLPFLEPQLITVDEEIDLDYELNDLNADYGFDPDKLIRKQEPAPTENRKAIDNTIFDALDLTEQERKEVYWSVAELVKQRLDKAASR